MDDKTTPPADCSYCGWKNVDRQDTCGGCGNKLVETAPPPREPHSKSMVMAVLLALAFGPLGLLYVNPGVGVALIGIGLAKILIFRMQAPIISFVGMRIICISLAVHGIYRHRAQMNPENDPELLLNKAAALETTDKQQAIDTYEDIARRFAGTVAGKEAVRNIEVLRRTM